MRTKYIISVIIMLLITVAVIFSVHTNYSETITISNLKEPKFMAEGDGGEDDEISTQIVIRYYDFSGNIILDEKTVDTYDREVSVSDSGIRTTYNYTENSRNSMYVTYNYTVDSNQQSTTRTYQITKGYKYNSVDTDANDRIIYLNFFEVLDTEVIIRYYDHTGHRCIYEENKGMDRIEDIDRYVQQKLKTNINDSDEQVTYKYNSSQTEGTITYFNYYIDRIKSQVDVYYMKKYEKYYEDEDYGTRYDMIDGNVELSSNSYIFLVSNKNIFENYIKTIAGRYSTTDYIYLGYFIEYQYDGSKVYPKINLYYGELVNTEIWIRYNNHKGEFIYTELKGTKKIEDTELYINRKGWMVDFEMQNSIEDSSGTYRYQSAEMEGNILYLDYDIDYYKFQIEIYRMEEYEIEKEDEKYGTEYNMIFGQRELLFNDYHINLKDNGQYKERIRSIGRLNSNAAWEYIGYYIDLQYDGYRIEPKINIYYTKATKICRYYVEYYVDGNSVPSDKEEIFVEIYASNYDRIPVDKNKINIIDKYDGYKFDAEATGEIPDIVQDGTIIKIYYKLDTEQKPEDNNGEDKNNEEKDDEEDKKIQKKMIMKI